MYYSTRLTYHVYKIKPAPPEAAQKTIPSGPQLNTRARAQLNCGVTKKFQ